MATKAGLYDLVDALDDDKLDEAERLLRALHTDDPVERSLLLAPLDDESLTPEEATALDEGRAAIARGDVVSTVELRRELGL